MYYLDGVALKLFVYVYLFDALFWQIFCKFKNLKTHCSFKSTFKMDCGKLFLNILIFNLCLYLTLIL